jgi:shikimate 5-dehydrogenase
MDGRNVYVSSRDTAKSGTLAGLHPDLRVLRWLVPVVGALVINATPLGMGNEAIPEEVMLAAGGLIDLPYADEVTRSAKASLEAGKPLVDGYEFLARQAAASFQWWTGARVDFEPLVAVARNT